MTTLLLNNLLIPELAVALLVERVLAVALVTLLLEFPGGKI
jgi:hypothetical protein